MFLQGVSVIILICVEDVFIWINAEFENTIKENSQMYKTEDSFG